MSTVLIILHVVVCTFLILVVLLQSGKGGGLGGTFGGSSSGSVFGGRGASSFLSKTTALMAGLFMVFSVLLTLVNFGDELTASAKARSVEIKDAAEETKATEGDDEAGADADKADDKGATKESEKGDSKAADDKAEAKPADGEKAAEAPAVPKEGEKAAPEQPAE
jgi:preprotein translocase subunit SecG